MRPSGLHVNKPVIFGLFAAMVVIFLVYRHLTSSTMTTVDEVSSEDTGDTSDDVLKLTDDVLKALQKESTEVEIKVEDTTVKIHIETVTKDSKPKLDVLFLHGAKFSSKDWLKIRSTDYVASWGYRAVAIDLPDKGPDKLSSNLSGKFLDVFVKTLDMKNIVIIAPSASGSYALPYLFNDTNTSSANVVGFVPVAPVGTTHFKAKYPASKIPTLIVYGSKDINIFLSDLRGLPNHKEAKIEGAGHACYMEKPDAFHKALFHFLKDLEP